MADNTKTIILAGSPIEVPFLPIRLNKIAYPLCRKLHNLGFMERVITGKGQLDCSPEEMEDLIELAYVAAVAANPRITRDEFDNWPVTPPELVDCWFLLRYQTGGWIAPEPSAEGEDEIVQENDELGEAPEMEKPPT
jgi:hypothetical protein